MDSRNFNFPFEPYTIQREFMTELYQAIETSKIAIFESPTGTGKSLSLACGALTWLRDHKRKEFDQTLEFDVDPDEPAWMVENAQEEKRNRALQVKKAREQRLEKARKKEASLELRRFDGRGPAKKRKLNEDHPTGNKEDALDSYALEDYFSDDVASTKTEQLDSPHSGLSAETRRLLDKLGPNLSGKNAEEDSSADDGPIILYCSRTHSQLTQFASELQKLALPPVLADDLDDLDDNSDEQNTATEALRHLTLGSRKNLCINSKVSRLGSSTAINERCLDLQNSGVSEENKCQYLPNKDDEALVNKFRDYAHAKIRDIEDLGRLGKAMCLCPYYASRKAIQSSEIVTLPYPLLLQKSSREALGISIKNNIIIIDEAHNLMDAICGLYSCSISCTELRRGRDQLMTYLQKFKTRLKGKNRVYVTQCVRVLDSLLAYMEDLRSANVSREGVCDAAKLLSGKGVDQINLFKLNAYIQKSKLARKVDGYTEYVTRTNDKPLTTVSLSQSTERSSTPTLMQIQSFMVALMNLSKEGRFGYVVEGNEVVLRYMLLDPSSQFKDIVDEARAVILAGGTMSPMEDYLQFLLAYLPPERISTLSCSHIVPASSLTVFTVTQSSTGQDFDFKYSSRSDAKMIAAAGDALVKFSNCIPDGVVAFFPSYAYMEDCVNTWQNTASKSSYGQSTSETIWSLLQRLKPVFFESKATQPVQSASNHGQKTNELKTDSVLSAFTTSVKRGAGGLLFAVVSGSLSEGINFSDELGRGVVIFGLPYPNPQSAEWKAKLEYITKNSRIQVHAGKRSPAQEFYENATMRAVNQAVGRAIRHRGDFAAIMLVDKRYASERIKKKLPGWMENSIQRETQVDSICKRTNEFFRQQSVAKV